MAFRTGPSFPGKAPKKGQSAAASYTDFYKGKMPTTKPEVSRTGSGTKPSFSSSQSSKPIPKKGRNDEEDNLEEKSKAIKRRLQMHARIKKAGSRAGAAMKKRK